MTPPTAALKAQAIADYEHGALDDAERLCRAVLAADAADFEASYLLAVIDAGRGRLGDAVAGYERALSLRPDHPGVLSARARALLLLRRFDAALADFDRLRQLKPDDAEALAGRGFALLAQRRFTDAAESYAGALATQPDRFDWWCNRGSALHEAGRHAEALACFDRALTLDPASAAAWSNRGNTLHSLARHDEALADFDRALVLDPAAADALTNRGIVLYRLGRFAAASESFAAAIALDPQSATLLVHQGNCLRQLSRPEAALASYDRALALDPGLPDALSNRAAVLHALGRLEEALRSCDRAIALRPDFADALSNRGAVLHAMGRFGDALADLDAALCVDPDNAPVWSNRGLVLYRLARFAEAASDYQQALRLKPGDAEAQLNRAFMLLLLGRFAEGWEAYEARRRMPSWVPRAFAGPEWIGQDLRGKRVFLYAEQGLGDAIHFARFALVLAERGATPIVEVAPRLAGLMRTLGDRVETAVSGEPLPEFDFHCPLMSVPRLLGITAAALPGKTRYLTPDPDKATAWRQRLGRSGFTVGITWAGNPHNSGDRHRSMPLQALAPLLDVAGVEFYSLQVGPRTADLRGADFGNIVDLAAEQHDFTDAAAIVANLDLVLSVDTSVVHLAGALARPCWLMLSYVPDWRWLLDRSDSPWYPSVRLFRQSAPGDWAGVVAEVWAALVEAPARVPR